MKTKSGDFIFAAIVISAMIALFSVIDWEGRPIPKPPPSESITELRDAVRDMTAARDKLNEISARSTENMQNLARILEDHNRKTKEIWAKHNRELDEIFDKNGIGEPK